MGADIANAKSEVIRAYLSKKLLTQPGPGGLEGSSVMSADGEERGNGLGHPARQCGLTC